MTRHSHDLSNVSDYLLRDIAHKIQLKKTEYDLAETRYLEVHKYLARAGDRRFVRIYAQGSMAVGATIASRLTDDEYDIDVMLELLIDSDAYSSQVVLDWLHGELKGFPSARKVVRQTRCVTLEFGKLHLDVTPAVLRTGLPERTSTIFHSKTEKREDLKILANPWGFAEWFKAKTDPSLDVAMSKAVMDSVRVDPVPEQEGAHEKSNALLCLQLIKRWRNVIYDNRDCRKPPSVLLAKLIADRSTYFPSLIDALEAQVNTLQKFFADACESGNLVEVFNPVCFPYEKLSDRWPGDMDAQRQFAVDLLSFSVALREMKTASLEKKKEILAGLFGERPAVSAIHHFAEDTARRNAGSGLLYNTRTGGVALGAPSVIARPAARQTFFGGDPDDRD